MNNPLLTTLEIVHFLSAGSASLSEIVTRFDSSPAGVKRHLAEARTLGAVVVSSKAGASWAYTLQNWPAIEARTLRWIDLERSRTLLP
jgi:hypothetical protein